MMSEILGGYLDVGEASSGSGSDDDDTDAVVAGGWSMRAEMAGIAETALDNSGLSTSLIGGAGRLTGQLTAVGALSLSFSLSFFLSLSLPPALVIVTHTTTTFNFNHFKLNWQIEHAWENAGRTLSVTMSTAVTASIIKPFALAITYCTEGARKSKRTGSTIG